MKKLLTGMTSLGLAVLLCATPAFAEKGDDAKSKQQQQQAQQKFGAESDQQKSQAQGKKQTIKGKVAGVTSIGEAIIDPQSHRAVAVEVDYLTVLGSPEHGQGKLDHKDSDQTATKPRTSPATSPGTDKSAQSGQGRDNVYLVAITPETSVRTTNKGVKQSQKTGGQQKTDKPKTGQLQTGKQKDQSSNQASLADLEIGDEVIIEFVDTRRLRQSKADTDAQAPQTAQKDEDQSTTERQSAFRGLNTNGRNRVFVGEADSIRILSETPQSDQSQKTTSPQLPGRTNPDNN